MSDLVARIFHPALRTLPKYASIFQQEHLDALRVDFDILKDEYFNVESLEIEDDCVRTFVDKLHDVIEIPPAATGTSDSMTDTLINDLLVRVVNFDNWPFKVKLEPPLKLFITNGSVSASPEFVVNKKNIAFICVEKIVVEPPKRQSIVIKRWPKENRRNRRKAVITDLIKIRQYLLKD
ncbi:hypothetical protein RhiirA1_536819 [Rhizophagus irregularis]|uniref:Uncharacterized protein n=1 Tax=Rhizophagus irregularis TaxID=588596 RepID=A0A2N0RNB5_9GLOM|nr:hypothetical protein RhiirA1_536819 [Rhizophagus irregularis]